MKQIQIALYTEQPFLAEGMEAVLRGEPDLELAASRDGLSGILDCLRHLRPEVLVVHVIAGIGLAELREIRATAGGCRIVLWGHDLGGEFAFQAMQMGVRGIVGATVSIDEFLATLRSVHRGTLCFDHDLAESMLSHRPVILTSREGQLVSLVAQGLKNKEIAIALGITKGTVKVYLYKLFKKLGVNDRLEMALYGLKNLFSGQLPVSSGRRLSNAVAAPNSLLMAPRRLLQVMQQ